jgi:hypothetical protein
VNRFERAMICVDLNFLSKQTENIFFQSSASRPAVFTQWNYLFQLEELEL